MMKTPRNNTKINILHWIKNKLVYVTESPFVMSKYIYREVQERIFSPKIYFQKVREYYYWRTHKMVMETEWRTLAKYEAYCDVTTDMIYYTGPSRIMLSVELNKLHNLQVKKEELVTYRVHHYTDKKEEIVQMYKTKIDALNTITILLPKRLQNQKMKAP